VKTTGVFTGIELHLWAEQPYYDERLPVREDRPELNFNAKRVPISSDHTWQEVHARVCVRVVVCVCVCVCV
jgi:hypothetical protein